MYKLYIEMLKGKKIKPKNDIGCIVISTFGEWIHYNHYGSSATKVTFTNFKWIIKEIFKINDINNLKVEV